MLLSARKLAQLKILLGLDGRPLVNPQYIRHFISVPGRFKTYRLAPTKHSANTHLVDSDEIDEWNRAILSEAKKIKTDLRNLK